MGYEHGKKAEHLQDRGQGHVEGARPGTGHARALHAVLKGHIAGLYCGDRWLLQSMHGAVLDDSVVGG